MDKAGKRHKNLINLYGSVIALSLSMVTGGIIVAALGVNPIRTYAALFQGAFGSIPALSGTVNRMIPIIMAGLAIALAKKGSVFNIGVEGQILCGAFAAALVGAIDALPGVIHLPLTVICGTLAGVLWASLPAVLKMRRNVSVVFSCIMLNYVAKFLVVYLMYLPSASDRFMGATAKILPTAMIPDILGGAVKINGGILLALLAVVGCAVFISRTRRGYEMQAVGMNPNAAGSAGIDVKFHMFLALLISGGLAGLGGALETCGSTFRMFETYNPGYMPMGIAVAMLAHNNPYAILITAFLFAAMKNGASMMQVSAGVSAQFVSIVQGLIIIFICSENLIYWLLLKAKNRLRKGETVHGSC